MSDCCDWLAYLINDGDYIVINRKRQVDFFKE